MTGSNQPLRIVTVAKAGPKAKDALVALSKELASEFHIVHVAQIDSITHIKAVLTSLIEAPQVLIAYAGWFDDEQEEIREIAKRILPNVRLIMVPPGLEQEGESKLSDYLEEQVAVAGEAVLSKAR